MSLPIEDQFQLFPKEGAIAGNMNLGLDKVARVGQDQGDTYSYVMTTVSNRNGELKQLGCGPNFQGGLLTICTCKGMMRTYRGVVPGTWIAGFTDRSERHGNVRNTLFYLTRVLNNPKSQYLLWNSLVRGVREAKAAHIHRLGDVFEPLIRASDNNDPALYRPDSYRPPRQDHPHYNDRSGDKPPRWHSDINYATKSGRQSFVVGDPHKTFIWSRPCISFRNGVHPGRTKRWGSFRSFIEELVQLD